MTAARPIGLDVDYYSLPAPTPSLLADVQECQDRAAAAGELDPLS